jgi:enoyl-CoA hydratase/carnithine racemase
MRFPADELLRLGIVEACVAPEELMPAALGIARTIASKSPVSTRMGIKQLFFCKFHELVLSCCARAVSQGFIVR